MLPSTLSIRLIAFIALLSLSGCQTSPPANSHSGKEPSDTVASGQTLFLTHCVACHQGEGNPPGPNSVILRSEQLNTEENFRALLRQPFSPAMRAFSEQDLDNASVHTLYTYLKTFRTPAKG